MPAPHPKYPYRPPLQTSPAYAPPWRIGDENHTDESARDQSIPAEGGEMEGSIRLILSTLMSAFRGRGIDVTSRQQQVAPPTLRPPGAQQLEQLRRRHRVTIL